MIFKKIASCFTALIMAAASMAVAFPAQQLSAEGTDILLGDINEDGTVTVKDLVLLKKFLCANIEFNDSQRLLSDINEDSQINIIDYVLIKHILLDEGVPAELIENAVASPDMSKYKRSYEKVDTADYNKFTANSAAVMFTDKENKNTNPVYSPISIYIALSMLAECADGDTLKELTDTLCADDIEELRKSNNDIFNTLYYDISTKDNTAYCKLANSFWLNDLYKYNNDTLKTLADSYYASSFLKNFADPETPEQISNWINKNTSGKFSPEIKIEDPVNEVIKIINTITFKENWKDEFPDSKKDIFHTFNNEDKECEFLRKTFVNSSVEYGEGFMKTSVPMNNGYEMNFVLSDKDTTVEQIVSSPEKMLDIVNKNTESKKANVIFSVPEFNVSSKFDLIQSAKKLGINSVFTGQADFSKISDNQLLVSQITHEATIQIDEKGCEAAAYTKISMENGSCFPDEVEDVEFILNRPFYYYVSDFNGTPVFSGIINDPTSK